MCLEVTLACYFIEYYSHSPPPPPKKKKKNGKEDLEGKCDI